MHVTTIERISFSVCHDGGGIGANEWDGWRCEAVGRGGYDRGQGPRGGLPVLLFGIFFTKDITRRELPHPPSGIMQQL